MCNAIKIVFEHFILLRVHGQYTHTHMQWMYEKRSTGTPRLPCRTREMNRLRANNRGMIGMTPGKRRPAKWFENEKSALRRNAHVEPDRIRLSIRVYNVRIVGNRNVFIYISIWYLRARFTNTGVPLRIVFRFDHRTAVLGLTRSVLTSHTPCTRLSVRDVAAAPTHPPFVVPREVSREHRNSRSIPR